MELLLYFPVKYWIKPFLKKQFKKINSWLYVNQNTRKANIVSVLTLLSTGLTVGTVGAFIAYVLLE